MSKIHHGTDDFIGLVIARSREIQQQNYKFKLPQLNRDEKIIAERIDREAKKFGSYRRHGRDIVDENWVREFNAQCLCYWAMHPGMDIFADLLEIEELTDDGNRICLPGVRPDQVEARKEMIRGALDGYAEHLIEGQKTKRGRAR